MEETQPTARQRTGLHSGSPFNDITGDAASTAADNDLAPSEDELEDRSLTEDIAGLIDSGRTYAEAELAFQKTRAALAGRIAAKAAGWLVLALVILHIAFIVLGVGLVMALAPLITIWGAILVVVGAMLLGVGLLVRGARQRISMLSAIFASSGDQK
jgi:hypothetical protein